MDRKNRHNIDVVFVLVLFAVFAVSVLMVLMLGVSSYNDITHRMEDNYENRTAVAYIAEKMRQSGGEDCVSIGQYSEQPALIMEETIDGEDYATYIYYYDGSLREIFTYKDNFLEPQAGEVIVDAKGFELEKLSEDLIKVTVRMDDESSPFVLLNTRAGKVHPADSSAVRSTLLAQRAAGACALRAVSEIRAEHQADANMARGGGAYE